MPDRKPLISGNWKMHHNHFEALATVQKLSYNLTEADYDAVDVSVHPPFTDLRTLQTWIENEKDVELLLGAQNCHWEEKGAFTGEVAPSMLAKLNVTYVIAGHSERRELFGETDEDVNRKVKAILAAGMTPIMCCGETLEEREAGQTEDKVTGQVRGRTRRSEARRRRRPRHRLRAHLGHRHRQGRLARGRPGRVRPRRVPSSGTPSGPAPPTASGSSTGARSSPATPPS